MVGNVIVDTFANAQDGYWTTDTSGTLTVCQSTDSWNVHYDVSTNTLTLNGAKITGGDNLSNAGIYAAGQNVSLTIVLQGKNTITSDGLGVFVYAPSTGAASLNITEGEGGGSLTTSGFDKGISVQSNSDDAALTIEDADVEATCTLSSGDDVRVQAGESSDATLTVDGGSLTAAGRGNDGAGIRYQFGSGRTGSGNGYLNLLNNAFVDTRDGGFASNSSERKINDDGKGIVFIGKEGFVLGEATLREDLTIGSGQSLTVPDGASLSIPSDVTLTVNGGGTLTGSVTGNVIYKVTGVSLNQSEMTLIDGETGTLTAIFTPDNATNQAVTWEGSDTSVATVNNGLVTAVGEGTATITVTTEDGGKTASCAVTVTSASEPDPDPTPEPEPEPEPEPTPEPEPEEPEEVYIPSAPIADGLHEYSMGTMLYLDGKRVKGLYEYEGALYYFDESGFMVTGWVELPDGWYYFGADGKMVTGWLQIGNVWYYLEPKTGRMADNGLHMVGRTTYYFYDWGGMASDWWYEDENGDWYFFGGSGAMKAACWVEWKGEWYYLTETGKMAADADIGGYYVNAEGVWVE